MSAGGEFPYVALFRGTHQEDFSILGILGWPALMPISAFGQTAPSTDRNMSRDDKCISLLNFQIPDSGMAITKAESVPTAPD